MKVVLQRVSKAQVLVAEKIVGEIDAGVLVFLGVATGDGKEQIEWLAQKLVNLRIFDREQSLLEVKGEMLVVSQFTLYADCLQGRRPSYVRAAKPEVAKPLYEQFVEEVRKSGLRVQTGVFGAEMKVSLVNEGPVTITLER